MDISLNVHILGDCNSGKSALARRLAGGDFVDKQPEVVTSASDINMDLEKPRFDATLATYRSPTDVRAKVLLHVLEDRGSRPAPLRDSNSLSDEKDEEAQEDKGESDRGVEGGQQRGADAIIFTVHPGKRWTLDYVLRALPDLPGNVPVLVLFGFMDIAASDRTAVTEADAAMLREEWPSVDVLHVSLKTCYGLRKLHAWLELPYLRSKADLARRILHSTEAALEAARAAASVAEEETHDEFIARVEASKAGHASVAPPALVAAAESDLCQTDSRRATPSTATTADVASGGSKQRDDEHQQRDSTASVPPINEDTQALDDFYGDSIPPQPPPPPPPAAVSPSPTQSLRRPVVRGDDEDDEDSTTTTTTTT